MDEANKNETLDLTDEQFTPFTKIMGAEIMKGSLRKQVLREIEESCKKDEKLKELGDDKFGKMMKALAAKAKRYSAESKTSQE